MSKPAITPKLDRELSDKAFAAVKTLNIPVVLNARNQDTNAKVRRQAYTREYHKAIRATGHSVRHWVNVMTAIGPEFDDCY